MAYAHFNQACEAAGSDCKCRQGTDTDKQNYYCDSTETEHYPMCPSLQAFTGQQEVLPNINLKVLELAGHYTTTNLANGKSLACGCEPNSQTCTFTKNGGVSLQWGKFTATRTLFAELARDFRNGVLCSIEGKIANLKYTLSRAQPNDAHAKGLHALDERGWTLAWRPSK